MKIIRKRIIKAKNRLKSFLYFKLPAIVFFIIFVFFMSHGCLNTSRYKKLAKAKKRKIVVKMKVTGYCSCGKCCNWKRKWLLFPVIKSGPNKGKPKKVGICADGTKAKHGTIAADTSIYPIGTVMYVPGYGWGQVHDTGKDIKGNHIDVFFKKHKDAEKWGVKYLNVEVYK